MSSLIIKYSSVWPVSPAPHTHTHTLTHTLPPQQPPYLNTGIYTQNLVIHTVPKRCDNKITKHRLLFLVCWWCWSLLPGVREACMWSTCLCQGCVIWVGTKDSTWSTSFCHLLIFAFLHVLVSIVSTLPLCQEITLPVKQEGAWLLGKVGVCPDFFYKGWGDERKSSLWIGEGGVEH